MFDVKYGLIFLSKKDIERDIFEVIHFVGFETEPSQSDRDGIWDEVMNGDEFTIKDEYGADDIIMIDADEYTLSLYKSIIANGEEYNKNDETDEDDDMTAIDEKIFS